MGVDGRLAAGERAGMRRWALCGYVSAANAGRGPSFHCTSILAALIFARMRESQSAGTPAEIQLRVFISVSHLCIRICLNDSSPYNSFQAGWRVRWRIP